MNWQAYESDPRQSIPQQRIVSKLDEYMSRRDYAAAERHLLYWLEEARATGDERGELMVRNELVGHFRKTGDKGLALLHGQEALRLVEELDFGQTISAGTTYVNVATANNAFGENERAMHLFEKAREIYEGSPRTSARLLGGLYNNLGLTCAALCKFDEAERYYRKAIDIMATVEGGRLEQAITYLNMADAVASLGGGAPAAAAWTDGEDEHGNKPPQVAKATSTTARQELEAAKQREAQIESYLEAALERLDAPDAPRDGYYAFVCEKCAPAFGYHGYFLAEADLKARAEAIYARA